MAMIMTMGPAQNLKYAGSMLLPLFPLSSLDKERQLTL